MLLLVVLFGTIFSPSCNFGENVLGCCITLRLIALQIVVILYRFIYFPDLFLALKSLTSTDQLSTGRPIVDQNPGWLGYIGDEILPSYVGIVINHSKDPHWTISMVEVRGFFSWLRWLSHFWMRARINTRQSWHAFFRSWNEVQSHKHKERMLNHKRVIDVVFFFPSIVQLKCSQTIIPIYVPDISRSRHHEGKSTHSCMLGANARPEDLQWHAPIVAWSSRILS